MAQMVFALHLSSGVREGCEQAPGSIYCDVCKPSRARGICGKPRRRQPDRAGIDLRRTSDMRTSMRAHWMLAQLDNLSRNLDLATRAMAPSPGRGTFHARPGKPPRALIECRATFREKPPHNRLTWRHWRGPGRPGSKKHLAQHRRAAGRIHAATHAGQS